MHKDKLVIDFKEKAELFNGFFIKQCFVVNNNRELATVLAQKNCKSLSTAEFSTNEIFNPNKAHCYDMINIRLLKICESI